MSNSAREKSYISVMDEHVRSELNLSVDQTLIPIAVLGLELKHPDHYTGPDSFQEYVNFADSLVSMKGEVPPSDRWREVTDIPAEVEVAAHHHPLLYRWFDRITFLARTIKRLVENEQPFDLEAIAYAKLIDDVMKVVNGIYLQHIAGKEEKVVAIELLNGAARFTNTFSTKEGSVLSVKANRVDSKEGLYVGLNWNSDHIENLRHLHRNGMEKMVISITDDCIATAASMIAAIASLQHYRDLPKIEEVIICSSVGVQPAVEKLIATCRDYGIPKDKLHIIYGVTAYGLSDEYYIERVKGEPKSIGENYRGKEPFVFDMGLILSEATRALSN